METSLFSINPTDQMMFLSILWVIMIMMRGSIIMLHWPIGRMWSSRTHCGEQTSKRYSYSSTSEILCDSIKTGDWDWMAPMEYNKLDKWKKKRSGKRRSWAYFDKATRNVNGRWVAFLAICQHWKLVTMQSNRIHCGRLCHYSNYLFECIRPPTSQADQHNTKTNSHGSGGNKSNN